MFIKMTEKHCDLFDCFAGVLNPARGCATLELHSFGWGLHPLLSMLTVFPRCMKIVGCKPFFCSGPTRRSGVEKQYLVGLIIRR